MEGLKEGFSSIVLIISCGLFLIFAAAGLLCLIQHRNRTDGKRQHTWDRQKP